MRSPLSPAALNPKHVPPALTPLTARSHRCGCPPPGDARAGLLSFESRFESGNLRAAAQVYENEYDLWLATDVNERCAAVLSTSQGGIRGQRSTFLASHATLRRHDHGGPATPGR